MCILIHLIPTRERAVAQRQSAKTKRQEAEAFYQRHGGIGARVLYWLASA